MKSNLKRLLAIVLMGVGIFTLTPSTMLLGEGSLYVSADTQVTGVGFIEDSNGQWIFVRNGKHDTKYTGLAKVLNSNSDIYLFATEGVFDPSFNGLVKYFDKYYGVIEGRVNFNFTGLVKNAYNDNLHFVRRGVYDTSYSGLAKSITDGKLYYVTKGNLDRTYTGHVKYFDEFYGVKNGAVDYTYTGIMQNKYSGKWFFVRKGKYDNSYSGLAKRIDNNKLYYVTKGVFDKGYTGHVKYFDDFYGVRSGAVDYGYIGIMQNKYSGKWFFVRKGKYDNSYTGLAKRVDNDKLYYVTKGVFDSSYTGLVKYFEDFYAVRNGAVDYTYTGIIQNKYSGKWHFVRKGKYDKSYSGLAKRIDNNKLYYVTNGVFDSNYTGLVKYFDDFYAVRKGEVDFTCTGIIQNKYSGKWHYVKDGVYDKTYTGLARNIFNENRWYYVKNGYWNPKFNGLIKDASGEYTVKNGLVSNSYIQLNGVATYVNNNGLTNISLIPEEMKNNWVTRYLSALGFKYNDYITSKYAFAIPSTNTNWVEMRVFTPSIPYNSWDLWMQNQMDIEKYGGDKGSLSATIASVNGLVCSGFVNFAYAIYWKYGENGKYASYAEKYRNTLANGPYYSRVSSGYRHIECVGSIVAIIDELQNKKMAKGYNIEKGKTLDDYPVAIGDILGFIDYNEYKWLMNAHVGIYMGKHNGKHWMAHTSNDYTRISITTVEDFEHQSGETLGSIVHFLHKVQ